MGLSLQAGLDTEVVITLMHAILSLLHSRPVREFVPPKYVAAVAEEALKFVVPSVAPATAAAADVQEVQRVGK